MKILLQKIVLVCAILLLVVPDARCNVANINGIVFRGNDYSVDSRTSLCIPGGGRLLWDGNRLEVDFDLKVSRHGDHFGYVCSIGTDAGEIVSLFLSNPKSGSPYLCTVDDGGRLRPIRNEGVPLDIYDWNRICLVLESAGDSIKVSENGQTMFSKRHQSGRTALTVIFGKGHLLGKSCVDVAPMEIRDIRLSLGDGEVYDFPLDPVDTDTVVYDRDGRLSARMENHEWIINKHSRWKLVRSIGLDQKAYPVAAVGSPNLYLVSGDRVVKVDLIKQRVSETKYNGGIMDMKMLSNNFVVIGPRRNEQLLYYSIDDNGDMDASISRFDFGSAEWIPAISPRRQPSYISHSRYIEGDSVVVQMFGYGYHSYKNDLNKIWFATGNRLSDKSALDKMAPRYMSATGRVDDNHVIIYGGIGNMYGDQEFGTKVFNDLHLMDIRTDSLTCLLDSDVKRENGIAVDNLLYNDEDKSVMGLFFEPFKANTSLTLKKLDIADGGMKILSDSIPYRFSDINSSAMLLHLPQTDMLYAVTISRDPDSETYTTDIYTLQLPLLPCSTLGLVKPTDSVHMAVWICIVMAGLALVIWLVVCYRVRQRGRVMTEPLPLSLETESQPSASEVDNYVNNSDKAIGIVDTDTVGMSEAQLSPGITLLGGFKVINHGGENITGSFTPILRQILMLVVLYTEKNGEGVSNSLLKDCLWYDKSDESFLNNRSVNMRKLRVLLPEVGDLKLGVSHGNWHLDTEDCNLVDYYAVRSIMKSIVETDSGSDIRHIGRLLEYASRGPLLPECQFEWLDAFKGEYSDSMIQVLHLVLDDNQVSCNKELALRVANCILLFDSIDENAVKAKCNILLQANRVGSAAKAFDRFVKEYHLLMNEPFGRSFNEFVE